MKKTPEDCGSSNSILTQCPVESFKEDQEAAPSQEATEVGETTTEFDKCLAGLGLDNSPSDEPSCETTSRDPEWQSELPIEQISKDETSYMVTEQPEPPLNKIHDSPETDGSLKSLEVDEPNHGNNSVNVNEKISEVAIEEVLDANILSPACLPNGNDGPETADMSCQDDDSSESSCSGLDSDSEELESDETVLSIESVSLEENPKVHSDEAVSNIWKIVVIPDKGLGMIATTYISRGTLVLAEAPMIQMNRFSEPETAISQFDSLSPEEKTRVLSLYNYREEKGALMGIIWTNAIPLAGTNDETGLFMNASRINHECNPNTHHSWDKEGGLLRTFATRDIAEGEELTSSYMSSFATFQMRQSQMKKLLGFTCRCRLCSLPEEERDRSDKRLIQIRRMRSECNDLNYLAAFPVIGFRYIRNLLRLYKEEGIVDHHPAQAYKDAFHIAMRAREAQRAAIFAEYAAAIFTSVEGEGSCETKEMQRLATTARKMMRHGDDLKQEGSMPLEEEDGFECWLFREKINCTGNTRFAQDTNADFGQSILH